MTQLIKNTTPANPGSTYIGANAALGSNFDGDMLFFQVYDTVLTATQRADLHIDMMEKINKI